MTMIREAGVSSEITDVVDDNGVSLEDQIQLLRVCNDWSC